MLPLSVQANARCWLNVCHLGRPTAGVHVLDHVPHPPKPNTADTCKGCSCLAAKQLLTHPAHVELTASVSCGPRVYLFRSHFPSPALCSGTGNKQCCRTGTLSQRAGEGLPVARASLWAGVTYHCPALSSPCYHLKHQRVSK